LGQVLQEEIEHGYEGGGKKGHRGLEDVCFTRIGRTWLARSELGMVSQGTHGVVVVSSPRFTGCWEGESTWVRSEEFGEVAYAWRWKGYSVFCESWTAGEDVLSSFNI